MASRSYGENWGPIHFGVLFTSKDTVHSDDAEIDAASNGEFDAMADAVGPPSNSDSDHVHSNDVEIDAASNSDIDAINGIIAAIIDRGDESLLVNRLRCLTPSQVTGLTETKLPAVHEGKLTVFGHVCVTSESYSEEVLRLLFTTAGVNFSEQLDNHRIPLLHLAAYCGNTAAVEILLDCGEGINFDAKDDKSHTALHMAVKSGDRNAVYFILRKSRAADRESFANFLNSEDALGMTALQHAAWEGHEAVIECMLRSNRDINVNAGGEHGFTALHLASWNGHIEVVKLLLKMMGRDLGLNMPTTESLHWISGGSCLSPRSRQWTGNSLARRLYFQEIHLESISNRRKRVLNLEKTKQTIQWSRNRDYGTKFLSLGLDVADVAKIKGLTALHCAAYNGHRAVVQPLMDEISRGLQVRSTLNPVDDLGLTPLHYAAMAGDRATVEMLFNYPRVRGDVKDPRSLNLTPLIMAHHLKDLGFQRVNMEEIVALLLEQSDVKVYIDKLYKDRKLFVDAANAILVGAALIASITFAGWLQPPLNYQQYYRADYLLTGAAPPDTYASYAAVRHHVGVVMFWIFNSLSFFSAIATVLLGACVVLPMLGNEELENDVSRMRKVHIWTTLALSISVLFVLGAFIAAGFAVLPPTLEYQLNMIMTTSVGGSFAFCALCYYSYRVVTLIRKIEMKTGGMKMRILRLKNFLERLLKVLLSRTSEKVSVQVLRRMHSLDDISYFYDEDSRRRGYGRRPNPPPGVIELNRSVWKVYSPPEGVAAEVDIIFFHGLQEDGDYEDAFWKTWVARDDNEVIWPMHWLSLQLPTARMFFVSYASSATEIDLNVVGENLLQDILGDGSDIGQKCPVFLVGHCLGGIAIKHFLVSALGTVDKMNDQSREFIRCKTFVDNVKGVCYYATPHHNESHLARFASDRQKNPSPTLRLLTTIDTEKPKINEKFRYLRGTDNIRTYGIDEGLPTYYLGIYERLYARHPSALQQVHDFSAWAPHHFSVCKARNPNDPTVIGQLISFINGGYC